MKDHELKIIRHFAVLLLLVTSWAWGNQRTKTTLTENWHIKQLDKNKPDVAALTRSAASPDRTWLPARMPAQMHEILLQHGKISDPHIDKNTADSAWVGEKDLAYSWFLHKTNFFYRTFLLTFLSHSDMLPLIVHGLHDSKKKRAIKGA